MIILFQKVLSASIKSGESVQKRISAGVLCYLGFEATDTPILLEQAVHKVLTSELIPDDKGRMTNSLINTKEPVLLISQFTLCASLSGKSPSFTNAKKSSEAKDLYNQFIKLISEKYKKVEYGEFGSYLQVESVNDGPVNFLIKI